MYKNQLGKQGEDLAIEHLKQNNYEILERNFHKRSGEIDIIAFDRALKEIVFVEVKTRRKDSYGRPEEAVNMRKIEKIEETGQIWLEENSRIDEPWRIDIIAIEMKGDETVVDHLKNVTQAL